jgi:hypothetical protein
MALDRAVRWLLASVLLLLPPAAAAKSLSQQMSEKLNPPLGVGIPGVGTLNIAPTANFVVPALQQLAIQGADFPSTSTVPGATFVYNPQLGVFERSSSLGPVFVERADTVGANRFEVGLSFLYANLDQIDGGGFGTYGKNLALTCTSSTRPCPTDALFGVQGAFTMTKFDLRYYVWNLSATYGITDRWDVNIFLPLIDTRLSAREQVSVTGFQFDSNGNATPVASGQQTLSVFGSHFGVGDLLLRSKYRFLDEPFGMAAEMIVRVPTGSVDNFQGVGDVVLTPLLVMSDTYGPWDFHMNLGMAFDVGNNIGTRARYDLGVSYQVIEQLALLFDMVGSSGLDNVPISATGVGTPPRGVDATFNASGTAVTSAVVPRSDFVRIVPGIKFLIAGNVVGFAEAIIPVTNDGLQANVLPTAGVQFVF